MNKYEIPMGALDYKKQELHLRVTSPAEISRLTSCQKEPKTVEWLETFKEDDIFFDVGANVGAYSLIAATKLGSKGKVYAFEPAAPSFSSLVVNVLANKLVAKIVALPVAFGAKEQLLFVGLKSLEPGQSASVVGGVSEFAQPFAIIAMDAFIERYGIPCPTKVKIDVDGSELEVIKGMRKTLANPVLTEVLIEVNDGKVQERFMIENIFRAHDFKLKAKQALQSSLTGDVWNRLYTR